ncbi:MAG: hypothetical protein HY099_05315 [Nitrospirae bacterium]|nr:hypothetical protein [Nitrospirota bacterium]
MEINVSMDNDSLSIPVDNPFQPDLNTIMKKIEDFVSSKGTRLNGLDIKGLLPRMVRGVAGCEEGCPANALELVDTGFKDFNLNYIEGGILAAKAVMENGKELSVKLFPDF